MTKKPRNLADRLREAQALKAAARPAEAEAAFRNLAKLHPKHPQVLAGLGQTLLAQGRLPEAAHCLSRAVAAGCRDLPVREDLGVVLGQLGHLNEALALFDAILAEAPDRFATLGNRGLALARLGRYAEALDCFDRAMAQRPNVAPLHGNRGHALIGLGRIDEALDSFERAIALAPHQVNAWFDRGMALLNAGRMDEAIGHFRHVIALQPNHLDAANKLGFALATLGQHAEALAAFDHTLALTPDLAEAHSNRGNTLRALGRLDEALAAYDRAIELSPDYAVAHDNRARALLCRNELEASLASAERALQLNPAYAQAHSSRGNALHALDRLEEAVAAYDRAIAFDPGLAEAHSNRAEMYMRLGRPAEAARGFEDALAIEPDIPDANWNKSLLLLVKGEYAAGWALYEWRWRRSGAPANRHYDPPRWLGRENIAGRRIFLWWEQGLGDFIQFCRYAPLVAALGADVILEAPPALHPLARSLAGVKTLILKGPDEPPPFDFHCPLLSLPHALGTTLDTIPAAVPYLAAPEDRRALWRERLGPANRLRVGLAWSGSTEHQNDRNRSLPLPELTALFAMPVEFHSVQVAYRPGDLELLGRDVPIVRHDQEIRDFADTAALLSELDLLISVDTSVAHLAGALGRPVWLLIPHSPDFRWLLDRSDSPWYPTATLFRQPARGDWDSVVTQVAHRLAGRLDTRSPPDSAGPRGHR